MFYNHSSTGTCEMLRGVSKNVDSLTFADNSENQSRSCRPIWQMKRHIYSNILPKLVRSATIYCRVMAM